MTPTEALSEGLKTLFATSEFSDFQIICKSMVFKVHKGIIGAQGGFFAKVCKKGFKEGEKNEVTLTEDDPKVVRAALEYLYGIQYKVPESCENPAKFHIWVYRKADFFQLPKLKEYARSRYVELLLSGYDGARHGFFAASEVFGPSEVSDNALRNPLLSVTIKHLDDLVSGEPNEDLEGQRLFFLRHGDFAARIIQSQRFARGFSGASQRRAYICARCGIIVRLGDHAVYTPSSVLACKNSAICGYSAPLKSWTPV